MVDEVLAEEQPTTPQKPDPQMDVLLVETVDGGKLVSNEGRLIWQSPAGSRTVMAGA